MNLIPQTLNNFSLPLADAAIGLNPDIFETNVINIAILLGGVVYLGGNALSTGLAERQQKILSSIQEAEERLQQAVAKLAESTKQLEQMQLVLDTIKGDAEKAALQVKTSILTEGKLEIERLTASAKTQITTVEAKVKKQISDYVVTLALKRVTLQLETKLNNNIQQKIINRNISQLSA